MSENKDESGIDIGEYVECRVPFFKSIPGIMTLIFQPFFLLLSIVASGGKGEGLLTFFTYFMMFELVIFLFNTKNMTFVRLSKDYLIIKRKFYFFSKDVIYENSNIQEITIEFIKWGNHGGGNNKLRILTKDLDFKSYSLDLFKRRTFFDMKNAMIGYGINVTDLLNLTEKEFKTFMHK